MPDSYGKRNRDRVKASKAAAREERRVARNQRQREEPSPPGEGLSPEMEPAESTEGHSDTD
jgi:hypothetical protein